MRNTTRRLVSLCIVVFGVAAVGATAGASVSPSISIIAPTGFVNAADPDPYTVRATTEGEVVSVAFFRCDNSSASCSAGSWLPLGQDASAPYEASWPVDSDGNRALRAVASDGAVPPNTAEAVLDVMIDRTAPSGGSVSYSNGYNTSGTVTVATEDGTDAGSGIDASSRVLERRTAPLAGGACGVFGAWVATASPDALVSGTCAKYRYSVADSAGNTTTYTSENVVKVDTSNPIVANAAPSEFTGLSRQYFDAASDTFWFRPGGQGSFALRANISDPESGDASASFPNLISLSGWSDTSTGGTDSSPPYSSLAYEWKGDAAAPNARSVSGRNGAGLTADATIIIGRDDAPPNGGSLTYAAGYNSTGTVTVTTADGSDAGSGLNPSSGSLERRTAVVAEGVCADFGAWTAATSPANAVSSGTCVQYRYRISDNVGNQAVYYDASPEAPKTVVVDTSAPASPSLTLAESEPDEHVRGTTLYYSPAGSHAGTFTVAAATSDGQSGIAKVSFPDVFGADGGDDMTGPYARSYSWTATDSASGEQTVTVHNNAGLTTNGTFAVAPDTTAPSGGSISYSGGYNATGTVGIVTQGGTDTGAGLDLASDRLERRTATLVDDACGAFSAWTTGTTPDTLPSGTCAQYRYRISDNVGNETVYSSATVVKVDKSGPSAPLLSILESDRDEHVVGATLYYRATSGNGGSFVVEAATADEESGIEKISFPGVFGGDAGEDAAAPYTRTYSWTVADSGSGAKVVSAQNRAGLTANSTFTVTQDTAPPTGGSLSYAGGYDADGSVTITTANGTDALSGVDPASATLERRIAALSGGTCSAFADDWTEATNPDAMPPDTCAQYRHRVSDNVGNEVVHYDASVVRFDTTQPSDVSNISASAGDHRVTLRWDLPLDLDFKEVAIFRSRNITGAVPAQVYRGGGTSFSDTEVTNGVEYLYRIVSYDEAGNGSSGVQVTALPRSVYLVSPPDGAVVTQPPVLDWRPKSRATYYNVQLWRNGRKILSRWPTRTALALPAKWTYKGRVYRLTAARYRWYVWPGYGDRVAARYGKLLGWSGFTVASS